jgi:hypothetical protein
MKRELMEKRRGDYGFITCQRVGLADGAHADAIPNVAGGEGGHGAAKLDGVIHRYCVNRLEVNLSYNIPIAPSLRFPESWKGQPFAYNAAGRKKQFSCGLPSGSRLDDCLQAQVRLARIFACVVTPPLAILPILQPISTTPNGWLTLDVSNQPVQLAFLRLFTHTYEPPCTCPV